MTTTVPPAPFDPIVALPKIVLHDHLDGGLRPKTVIDLADAATYQLPESDPVALGEWFARAASGGSLPVFLEAFRHTVACMQTEDSLARVAREAVVDHAQDGAIYAEIRYAPELHTSSGLSLQAIVEAVDDGLHQGMDEARRSGKPILAAAILVAMRQADRSTEIAQLALANRDRCVGFDIAGPESGFPPSHHQEAFRLLRDERFPFTVHAGEAAGPDSIKDAIAVGAHRLGHGVRIIEDVVGVDGDQPVFGSIATQVRENRIPLEVCPTSNILTGTAASIASHPVSRLRDLGFVVTINPDNRLMCATQTSREMRLLIREAGWSVEDIRRATLDAAWAAFQPAEIRQHLVDAVEEGYASEGTPPW